MPIYEYQCKKCRHRFEKIQKFSDPHVKKCPKCGAALELLISSSAVQFKGSGWYVTDYARKSGAPAASNGDSASKKEGKTKTESSTKEGSSKSDSTKSEKK
jgi:putative FmdB family regulatory protein